MTYVLPDPLPWAAIAGPLAAAEDALARLDERLGQSPIREGWISRTHFTDAGASLWLQGALVHLEDLVLHDAGMDLRTPTHDLTRAHVVLRARRRVAAAEPGWATSPSGLAALSRGREEGDDAAVLAREPAPPDETDDERKGEGGFDDEAFAAALAAVDALLERSNRVLAGATPARAQDPLALVYDLDWDEGARLDAWRRVVDHTRHLPPLLAAALAFDAWQTIEPLQHRPWLGALVVSGLLRARGKARHHLPCLNVALRQLPHERRRNRESSTRLVAFLEAVTLGAGQGQKDHDRWQLTRGLLERKLSGRRKHSKLPALIDLVLARPLVSAGMIAAELNITPRAAQDLVAALGLRELTGRGRYRAWGVV
jgi:hypothetical protein